jgi:predicted phage tail protein
MKTIYLHGSLKELHPEPIKVHAQTAAEALSILKQLPGFDVENPVPVRVKDIECRDALYAPTELTELHVYPALMGGGGNTNILQVIIGAVLVIVGAILWWTGPAGGTMASVGISMMMGGAMVMLGGIIGMLAPSPKYGSSAGQQSLYIPANQNTVKIGTRIPLVYGRIRHFGHYLSFNVDAKKLDDADMNLAGYCSGRTDSNGNRYSYGQDGLCLLA